MSGAEDTKGGTKRFIRIVGKRRAAPRGTPPSRETREALTRMASYLTRAPRGVFVYESHEQANRDRDRWTVEAILARCRHDD
jgi:hypothetical protein